MENEKEYTIIEFCNGRKIAVKNNTPQANQTLDNRNKNQSDTVLGTLHIYLLFVLNDENKYSKEELTNILFNGIDEYGLLKYMHMIYNADCNYMGDLDGVNYSAIPYTEDTLFEVK